MVFIVIIAVAAVVLVFLAFSGGSASHASEIRDVIIRESVVYAVVKNIDVRENMGKRGQYLTYFITFDCDDEITREFEVSLNLYDTIEIGEYGELVYAGERFVGFGEHGAAELDSGLPPEDGFTYDDYDESIDVELDVAMTVETGGLDPEDQKYFELFLDREIIPAKTESIEDETDSLKEYSAVSLLGKITIYPFLKKEEAVRRIFFKAYGEAMNDLLGFEGDARKGVAADSASINKNEIRVSITLQERPYPLKNKIHAEFGVNE